MNIVTKIDTQYKEIDYNWFSFYTFGVANTQTHNNLYKLQTMYVA